MTSTQLFLGLCVKSGSLELCSCFSRRPISSGNGLRWLAAAPRPTLESSRGRQNPRRCCEADERKRRYDMGGFDLGISREGNQSQPLDKQGIIDIRTQVSMVADHKYQTQWHDLCHGKYGTSTSKVMHCQHQSPQMADTSTPPSPPSPT